MRRRPKFRPIESTIERGYLYFDTIVSQFECIGIALVKAILEWSSMFGHVISVKYIVLVTSGMAKAVLALSYIKLLGVERSGISRIYGRFSPYFSVLKVRVLLVRLVGATSAWKRQPGRDLVCRSQSRELSIDDLTFHLALSHFPY